MFVANDSLALEFRIHGRVAGERHEQFGRSRDRRQRRQPNAGHDAHVGRRALEERRLAVAHFFVQIATVARLRTPERGGQSANS